MALKTMVHVQLDKTIEVTLERIKTEKPKVPDFGPAPDLSLPK